MAKWTYLKCPIQWVLMNAGTCITRNSIKKENILIQNVLLWPLPFLVNPTLTSEETNTILICFYNRLVFVCLRISYKLNYKIYTFCIRILSSILVLRFNSVLASIKSMLLFHDLVVFHCMNISSNSFIVIYIWHWMPLIKY